MRNRLFLVLLCCLLLLTSCQHADRPEGLKIEVARVVSGQGLILKSTGDRFKGISMVRLIGIDAPSLQQQPWGRTAQKRLEEEIENRSVLLEFDVEEKDQFGRLLAYVWKDGMLLNEKLVAEGYVLAVPRAPNQKYDRRLEHAQEWARLMGRGIWDPEHPMRLTPAEFRRQNR
jgi:micrococcal nuclease